MRTLWATASLKSVSTRPATFTDLCRGPHVAVTSEIDPDSFRLTRVSGAYWRGNQAREQMQRVYGVAFDTRKELDDYFVRLEEAKKRDHRKLGQELDLFSINPDTRRRRPDPLASQRRPDSPSGRGILQEQAPRSRLRLRLHAAHRPGQSVGNQRTSRVSTPRTCTRRSRSTSSSTT